MGISIWPSATSANEKSSWQVARRWVRKEVKSGFSVASLKSKFPVIDWLRGYSTTSFQCDLIAGLTVGLTVIPQGIAYAAVAALPLQYGLYTAFMGCFVYCLLGSTKEINIGPTAIISLLTAPQVKIGGPAYAVALGFLSGIIELVFVVLNLGFLIDFISLPVISGFSSAAALIISATQLKGLLGLKFDEERFVFVLINVFEKITSTRLLDFAMGVSCLIILLILRKLSAIKWEDVENRPVSNITAIARKALWLVCTARNAIIVIGASLIAYVLSLNGHEPFALTGRIAEGLPDFQPPPFSFEKGNTTISYWTMCSDLGGSIILIPLVSILEHIAIAKVFAHGKSVNAKQEFLALGFANICGSFVSAYPSTGSFSRTALNGSCGVKTPVSGLYTGFLVLLALGVLAPTFKFIPKASLSAVIISAVVFMIEYEMVVDLWKSKKAELFIMMATFFSCLIFSAEYGILIGIGLSLLMLLYNAARPRIRIERATVASLEYICIQPDQNLFFPAIEYLRFRVNKAKDSGNETIPIVFDGSHISSTDYTIAQGIKQILDDFQCSNQKILFTNFRKEVMDLLNRMDARGIMYFSSVDELEALVEASPPLKTKEKRDSMWDTSHDVEICEDTVTDVITMGIKSPQKDVKSTSMPMSLSNGLAKPQSAVTSLQSSAKGSGELESILLANDRRVSLRGSRLDVTSLASSRPDLIDTSLGTKCEDAPVDADNKSSNI